MAGRAALGSHRSMLERERPAHIRVALGADGVLVFSGLLIVGQERPVYIVAVAALDQPFVDLVVDGHIELRLLVSMALVAERRLRSFQQLLFSVAGMYAMAARAAHVRPGMRGTIKIRMSARVATHALLIHLFRRMLRRIEDLRDVAAAINVRLACTVAVLAGRAIAAVHLRHLGVRIVLEFLAHLCMTGDASFGSNKV